MKKLAPQWIVQDVVETIEFYRDMLGFEVEWVGEPPLFAMLSMGEVVIMIRALAKPGLLRPNQLPFIEAGWDKSGAQAWDAYIWVDNVEKLYQHCCEKGVKIVRRVEDMDYGNREFDIEDNNGYILCFGQALETNK